MQKLKRRTKRLKALNPNAKIEEDAWTPEELLDFIEQKCYLKLVLLQGLSRLSYLTFHGKSSIITIPTQQPRSLVTSVQTWSRNIKINWTEA